MALPKIIFSSSDEETEDENDLSQVVPIKTVKKSVEKGASLLPMIENMNCHSSQTTESDVFSLGSQSQSILPSQSQAQSWKSSQIHSVCVPAGQLLHHIKDGQEKIIKTLKTSGCNEFTLRSARVIFKDVQQSLCRVNKLLSEQKKKLNESHESQKENNSQSTTSSGTMMKTAKKVLNQQKVLIKLLKIHKEVGKKLDVIEKIVKKKDSQRGTPTSTCTNQALPKLNQVSKLHTVVAVKEQEVPVMKTTARTDFNTLPCASPLPSKPPQQLLTQQSSDIDMTQKLIASLSNGFKTKKNTSSPACNTTTSSSLISQPLTAKSHGNNKRLHPIVPQAESVAPNRHIASQSLIGQTSRSLPDKYPTNISTLSLSQSSETKPKYLVMPSATIRPKLQPTALSTVRLPEADQPKPATTLLPVQLPETFQLQPKPANTTLSLPATNQPKLQPRPPPTTTLLTVQLPETKFQPKFQPRPATTTLLPAQQKTQSTMNEQSILKRFISNGTIKPESNVISINYKGELLHADLLSDGSLRYKNVDYTTPEEWIYFVRGKQFNEKSALRMLKFLGKSINSVRPNTVTSEISNTIDADMMCSSEQVDVDFISSNESNKSSLPDHQHQPPPENMNVFPKPEFVRTYADDEFIENLLPSWVWDSKGFGALTIDEDFLKSVGFDD